MGDIGVDVGDCVFDGGFEGGGVVVYSCFEVLDFSYCDWLWKFFMFLFFV